jgi:pimeloyl-ACP methyl ester carboxylesterase
MTDKIFKFSVKVLLLLIAIVLRISVFAQESGKREPASAYKSENVIFSGGKQGLQLGATLTLPYRETPAPAVILVSGTGKQDRDGTMGQGYKMFFIIAEYLSTHGIAVLRVDDRGVGETNGVYEGSTTGDFAEDVLASISFLKSRKEIDSEKIGLIGHSEGGAVISIAAAQSKDVAFIVSIAGLSMNGLDALIRQNADIVAAANIPDYDKKRSNEINELMFKTVYDNVDSDSLGVILNETYNSWKKKDDEYFKTLNKEFDHFRFPIYSYVNQAQSAWYRFFIKYDPADYLSKINLPILALNGEQDLMVACKDNLYNWVRYSNTGGNYDVKIVVLPGLNHLFQQPGTDSLHQSPLPDKRFSPVALKIISDWIHEKVD